MPPELLEKSSELMRLRDTKKVVLDGGAVEEKSIGPPAALVQRGGHC